MRFNNFIPIGMMALLPAFPLVMADDCTISKYTETYQIKMDYCFYHDYGLVDVRLEIPGADFKGDHVELPAHVKANANPIHLDETYKIDIYFKNDWTTAHRWEASIPVIGPTLYVDLESRIVRSNCKLGLKLHLTGTGVLGALEESIPLTEIENDNIKFFAKAKGLC